MSRTRHLTVVDGSLPLHSYAYINAMPLISSRPALDRVRVTYLPKAHPAQAMPGSPVDRWLQRLDAERAQAAEQLADEVSRQL